MKRTSLGRPQVELAVDTRNPFHCVREKNVPAISRRDFLARTARGAAAWAGMQYLPDRKASAARQGGEAPNFVFILIDDLGWRDLGCFGSQYYETPNVDRLAASGMRFTNFYAAAPVCSPTRASIMTGRYPARVGVTAIIQDPGSRPLPLEEVTIAERLKDAGYATCAIGKWHLGERGLYPEDQGFDINLGGTHSGMTRDFFYPAWRGNRSDPRSAQHAVPVEGEPGEYLPDRLSKEALRFIEANKDRPFFLYLSHYTVHTPMQAKPEIIRKYRNKLNIRYAQNNPVYAAMVQSMDESVGNVLGKIEELALDRRTVIIFTSDNGGLSTWDAPNTPATNNAPLLGGKGFLYEGGIRVPAIVRWPGISEPGSASHVPAISNDFFPTMLEMAGLPLDPRRPVDGVSLAPLLRGGRSLKRDALYWHYPHFDLDAAEPGGAIRQGDYKLIEFYTDHRLELYNLNRDLGESTNLSQSMPAKASELHRMLDGWRRSVGARAERPQSAVPPG